MIYTLLSIALSALLVMLLREFTKRNLDLLQIITTNYIVCVCCGVILNPNYFTIVSSKFGAWAGIAFTVGFLFMNLFFLIGKATGTLGIAFTGIITKISVLVPTLAAIVFFGEELNWQITIGLVLAILAIILIHIQYFQHDSKLKKGSFLLLSIILFLGTGLADTLLKLYNFNYSGLFENPAIFTLTVFFVSALSGVFAVLFRSFKPHAPNITMRNIAAGVLLGVPNYFSIIVLLKALEQIPASIFFPFNNIGILFIISLSGVLLYNEKFSKAAWLGLFAAALALWLLAS